MRAVLNDEIYKLAHDNKSSMSDSPKFNNTSIQSKNTEKGMKFKTTDSFLLNVTAGISSEDKAQSFVQARNDRQDMDGDYDYQSD